MSYPNTTPGTAVPITIPWTITLDEMLVDPDLGAWYSFTTGDDYYVSIQIENDGSEHPGLETYLADGTTLATGELFCSRTNPLQQPVSPSLVYYFKVTNDDNPVDETLFTITAEFAPNASAPAGSILVTDDTQGFPGLIFDFQGNFLRAVPTVSGENGDCIPNGNIALVDNHGSDDPSDVVFYDAAFALLQTVPQGATGTNVVAVCSDLDVTFWVATPIGSGGSTRTLLRYSASGVLQDTYTASIGKLSRIGAPVSTVNEFVYWTTRTADDGVMIFDLATESFLSDFVSAPISGYAAYEVVVLANDHVLVCWQNGLQTISVVYLYDETGSQLNTFTMPSGFRYDHMTRNVLSTTDFVLWTQQDSPNTVSKFQRIRLSDGATLDSVDYDMFQSGVGPSGTSQRFGNSPSCPLVLLTQEVPPPLPPIPVVYKPRWALYRFDLKNTPEQKA